MSISPSPPSPAVYGLCLWVRQGRTEGLLRCVITGNRLFFFYISPQERTWETIVICRDVNEAKKILPHLPRLSIEFLAVMNWTEVRSHFF